MKTLIVPKKGVLQIPILFWGVFSLIWCGEFDVFATTKKWTTNETQENPPRSLSCFAQPVFDRSELILPDQSGGKKKRIWCLWPWSQHWKKLVIWRNRLVCIITVFCTGKEQSEGLHVSAFVDQLLLVSSFSLCCAMHSLVYSTQGHQVCCQNTSKYGNFSNRSFAFCVFVSPFCDSIWNCSVDSLRPNVTPGTERNVTQKE